jgi:hypothetical protein
MPVLPSDFSNDPTSLPPIERGLYELRVEKADLKPNRKGDSMNIALEYVIVSDGPFKDRRVFDYVSLKMRTQVVRLFTSAGLGDKEYLKSPNTDDLVGRSLRVTIAPETYKDEDTGETRESSRIKSYVISEETK